MGKEGFLSASIGRKFLMSITGLFLVSFILVHLSLNLLLIFDDSGDLYNMGAHFMATNPAIKLMEPVLAAGFLIHIIWSFAISLENYKARPIGYNKKTASKTKSWASTNMLILGALVLVFLVIHIYNFWYHVKIVKDLGEVTVLQAGIHVEMEDAYTLVADLFRSSVVYCLIYIVGAVLLGFHLAHGFWSAFQTIGFNNDIWMVRLKFLANLFAWVVAIGFSVIPLYFIIKS